MFDKFKKRVKDSLIKQQNKVLDIEARKKNEELNTFLATEDSKPFLTANGILYGWLATSKTVEEFEFMFDCILQNTNQAITLINNEPISKEDLFQIIKDTPEVFKDVIKTMRKLGI